MIATKGAHVTNSYLFEVTPDVAKRMLESNYDKNRVVSKKWVTQLATMIRDGSYIYDNGQNAIVVDEDGTLYDGQHRLLAVIEAGVTQLMRINVVDNGEAIFQTLDNGKMRSASNFIGAREAAIARIAYCLERGDSLITESFRGYFYAGRVPTRLEITTYYQGNKAKVDKAATKAHLMYDSTRKGSIAVYGGFVLLLEMLGDDPSNFVELFGVDEGNEVSPIKFTIVRHDNVGHDRTWLLGTLLQGYEIVKAGGKVKSLTKQSHYIDRYNKLLMEARRNGCSLLQEASR